ncbi:hypothetical protein FIBSPDRAFT_855067 [Athelia psychrophila]|uniref:F-box domain-containing protein n=1 Tax=Athelia psychrophila TaxID=1759441 RepID=A0A166PIC2_9AGAM|nr:hypothetical protein FIBSPDRAFT_855067 [Fibularhizoctonia sp. CBS 109695]
MSGFDDSSSEAMAVAWPKLRGLILASYIREHIPTRCTMRTLSYLAHGCPDLEIVAITFSPSTAPYHVQTPNGNSVHLNLADLNVLHSPLSWSSAAGVASFLSDFFPCMHSITIPQRYTTPEDEQNLLAWREVRRLYEASGMARRDF